MSKKKSWIITMRCDVIKEVICNDCTLEEAKTNPWDYAVSETEMGQNDWEIEHIEENT